MELIKKVSHWKPYIQPALASKVDELKVMGYSRTNEKDVWDCMVEKVWKGDPEKKLYQVVQDLLHLNTSTYMSYLTVKAYKQDDLFAQIEAIRGELPEDA